MSLVINQKVSFFEIVAVLNIFDVKNEVRHFLVTYKHCVMLEGIECPMTLIFLKAIIIR